MAALVVHSAHGLDVAAQADPLVQGLQYFDTQQARTVEAIAERLWPASGDSAGAIEAGVVYYIDRSLAGEYEEYQLDYRIGLELLDEVSRDEHGSAFRDLAAEQQDSILRGIEAGELQPQPREGLEGEPPVSQDIRQELLAGEVGELGRQVAGLEQGREHNLQTFFNLVLTHTMEGLFSDPIYGGNRDFAGWRAVNYPGAHYVYTEEEQQNFEPLDKPFASIAAYHEL